MARKGMMTTKTIDSTFLQESITIKIYAPESFDSLYETNVCVMQDGDDYFQMGRVATFSDRLHDDGDIVNTYFVGIPYEDRRDRVRKYAPDGEQNAAYMQFLTEEVVPLLDAFLPINPLGTVRTLMGDSLAATLAFMTATQFPDIFHQVVMQSPFVDKHVLERAKDLGRIRMPIYHSIGLDEASVDTTELGTLDFIEPNLLLRHALESKVSGYRYEEIPAGNHTWKYWQNEMIDVMEYMFG